MKRGGRGGRVRQKAQNEVLSYDDPATEWARQVVEGKVVAGEPVVDSCRRHLSDLEEGRFIWDPSMGKRFEDFCRIMCRVSLPTQGGRVPFRLLDWQRFCAYSLLSWRVRDGDRTSILPGARRFRYGFILTAKGSGKSPFGAAMGLYMMTADKFVPLVGDPVIEDTPQCYVLASNIEQAEEVGIRHARDMLVGSEQLAQDMGMYPIMAHPQSIVSKVRGSYLRAVGLLSKQGGSAGLNAHYLQWEEMHEQRDRRMLDDYVAGFKGRPQPMLLMMTNSGRSLQTMAYEEYGKAKEAAKGHPSYDTYFSFIAECSRDDIPSNRWWPSEKHWEKANPSLGITIRKDIIKDRIAKAKSELDRAEVLRLYFSVWSDYADVFLSQDKWDRALVSDFGPDDEKLKGAQLYLGLDNAEKKDMVALAYLWRCTDGKWRLRVRYYSPSDGFEELALQLTGFLLDWRNDGWITTLPGGVIDQAMIAREVKAAVEKWGCRHLVCDNYMLYSFLAALDNEGQRWWKQGEESRGERRGGNGIIEVVNHSQHHFQRKRDDGRDLWMPGSINAFEQLVEGLDESGPTIEIEDNPVLSWNRSSAVVTPDDQNNRKFSKRQAKSRMHGKIDGLVAATMAIGVAVLDDGKGPKRSPWEDPNFSWSA